MFKRFISIVLITVMVIPLFLGFSLTESFATETTFGNPNIYEGMTHNRDDAYITANYGHRLGINPVRSVQGISRQVNLEILLEDGRVTYGCPVGMLNRELNDFKEVANGYFRHNGKEGEFRFIGFDAIGGRTTNANFPADAIDKSRGFSERLWIYRPWVNAKRLAGNRDPSFFYQEGIEALQVRPGINRDILRSQTKQWINAIVSEGTGDFGQGTARMPITTGPSDQPYEHLHVSHAPTSYHGGTGSLHH
ncbi:MAG: Athe_2463 domain-containing protein, partial [Alkaliphilus sp.]